ncbi:DUF1194 domain-containing protein [Oceaniglobus ichthyenteri]|uniref:DUF1194 domain-containing protein n=1 Tax=Oceaniglobus ichthyenteri TaxID=2136177 RepID=UPI000D3A6765|nr:DUF1194 domain-containing protein [Oceaniglobus ichthyenteri]
MIRAALALSAIVFATPGAATCRQALALGLDISGSVDDTEYRQQLDGLAAALMAPAVQSALLAMPGTWVEIAVYEWAGPDDQRLLLSWSPMTDETTIARAAKTLTMISRRPSDPSTALGAALAFGNGLLAQRPDCWRHAIDISGDGTSNSGPRPQDVRKTLPPHTPTINALIIGSGTAATTEPMQPDIQTLSGYFHAHVIHGPDAFVETASGFSEYRKAMERKLLRELQVLAIGRLPGSQGSDTPMHHAPNK